jgi:hypothetical protein
MIISAHQPSYLPWLGYLDKMAKADLFVLMDDLQYEAQNFQNRQRIKLASGPTWLTVPLVAGAQAERICDKRIDNSGSVRQHWQRRHWRSIEVAYARAPFFGRYAHELHAIFFQPWGSLLALDLYVLDLARRWLGIETPVVRSSELGLAGEKTDRFIDLCKKLGARAYLTGKGGSTGYLDVERMGRAGIGVIWQEFDHPVYPQRHGAFTSHLAFLDLVLNCGEVARDVLFPRSHPIQVPRATPAVALRIAEAA